MTLQSYKTFTLITGANGGLGTELARLCAADGRNLILVARQGDKLRALAQELGGDITIHIIIQDLSEHDAAQKVYKKVQRLKAEVDQLINNAGFGEYGEFARTNNARQEQMVAVNITFLIILTRLLLPRMIAAKHGRIMNLSSTAGLAPLPLMSVYAASKSFVLSFSQSLSEELRGTGITVTCLCPGPIKTRFDRSAHLPATHRIARTKVKPEVVARYGYRAMLTGTPVAIYGFVNKLLSGVIYKILPRSIIRRLTSAYNSL